MTAPDDFDAVRPTYRSLRHSPHVGLPQMRLPRLTAATAAYLRRQPARRSPLEILGRALYLQRLDATVLAHEPVEGGWLCTFVAVLHAPPGRLPAGVCLVDELELVTGLDVANPWFPHADLTAEEFAALWFLRERDSVPNSASESLPRAIVENLERTSLQIVTGQRTNPELRRSARIVHDRGLRVALRRLEERGFLTPLFTTDDDPDRRYGLRLPRLTWSA
jgi:hypothetical protein